MRCCLIVALLALELTGAPQRIVSTSPSITETLFALGRGDRVVGVSTYCHYPAAAEKLPRVGTYLRPSVETIARLKPDLVIFQRLPQNIKPQVEALGVPFLEVDSGNLQTNLDTMLAIGRATGREKAAIQLVAAMKKELAQMKASASSVRSVAFVVGRTPGRLEGLIAVGGGSYLNELLTAAGGRNVFADSAQAYVRVSLESMLRRNPAVLIDMGEMADTVGVSEERKQAVADLWRSQDALKSTIFSVASDIYVSPGPRMIDAARAFRRMLQAGGAP